MKIEEETGAVSATQPSMVDGGKLDVFCSNGSKFDTTLEDIYKQLNLLEDYNED